MNFVKVFASLLTALLFAPAAHAGIIGFENINAVNCCASVPANYQGFQWSGGYGSNASWVVSNTAGSLFSGTSAHSGDKFAWSNGGTNLTLSGSAFSLDSLWVREANGTGSVVFTGFTDGLQTYSASFNIDTRYQQLNLNFAGIDSLLISSYSRNILVDDIAVTANAVPEPATAATILLALGLMGFMRRKAKTK
jgi:hypothetical protein